ncbi:MAG: DNA alkylation repair protein [Pseudomonadales bacterium]|nr:DNA alkylation repair protein [Pseudomonadales bacterium]
MTTAKNLSLELQKLGNTKIAEHSQRFFKTGEGEYGAGDKFLGIRVPVLRAFAKKHSQTSLNEVLKLLKSKWHEERLTALLMLVGLYQKGNNQEKQRVYEAYLSSTQYINNWDLVDCSAHLIVGPHLFGKSQAKLNSLAKSKELWERRIAMMATFYYIKQDSFEQTLKLAKLYLKDQEDLIHKSTGWMLRELGKRNKKLEVEFLNQHYKNMPRTMLRYAIEKFPERERQRYLKGTV